MKFSKTRNIKRKSKSRSKSIMAKGIVNNRGVYSKLPKKSKKPRYRKTAAYGHFGRELEEFTWEKTDMIDNLISKL